MATPGARVLRSKVPVVMLDPKADLPNLFLTVPSLSADELAPRVEPFAAVWATDPEGARAALSATVSLLLCLIGRAPDPTCSRGHVVLSVFAERCLSAGSPFPTRTRASAKRRCWWRLATSRTKAAIAAPST